MADADVFRGFSQASCGLAVAAWVDVVVFSAAALVARVASEACEAVRVVFEVACPVFPEASGEVFLGLFSQLATSCRHQLRVLTQAVSYGLSFPPSEVHFMRHLRFQTARIPVPSNGPPIDADFGKNLPTS